MLHISCDLLDFREVLKRNFVASAIHNSSAENFKTSHTHNLISCDASIEKCRFSARTLQSSSTKDSEASGDQADWITGGDMVESEDEAGRQEEVELCQQRGSGAGVGQGEGDGGAGGG